MNDCNVGAIFSMQADYGAGVPESHQAYWAQPLFHGSPLMGRHWQQRWPGSYDGANALVAFALNAKEAYERGEDGSLNVTHIVLMHNDVVPEPGWLDKLIHEQLETGADFLSVVMPIKDMDGKSSCAIDDDPFEVTRRITMTEVYDLPPTFTAEDCGYPAGSLLCNHGLCVFDFTKPWWREENEDGTLAVRFTSPDRIKRMKRESGPDYWKAQHAPSDWHISRELNRRGAKVMGTRKVRCQHVGQIPFTNEHPWGSKKIDEVLKHKFGGKPIRSDAYCDAKPFVAWVDDGQYVIQDRATGKVTAAGLTADAFYEQVRKIPGQIDTRGIENGEQAKPTKPVDAHTEAA